MDTLIFSNEGIYRLLAFIVAAYFPFSALIWLTLEKKAERARSDRIQSTPPGDAVLSPATTANSGARNSVGSSF
jgi:hypothetical protein